MVKARDSYLMVPCFGPTLPLPISVITRSSNPHWRELILEFCRRKNGTSYCVGLSLNCIHWRNLRMFLDLWIT